VAILVPFREDGTGRSRQLAALIARLEVVFPHPGQCVVVVAEQSADDKRFNRGQLLNVAFLHLRAAHPTWVGPATLYCCHDCDMLPAPALAKHYLRPMPGGGGQSAHSAPPAVRVLQAGGCRYDTEACFGGVTLYNEAGYLATNGYPNGFWGWGGEDNAQFLRCVEERLLLERVAGCDFEDLEEGVDTVEEKLKKLDELKSRCSAKDKKRLLKANARDSGWRRDGLSSAAYEVVGGVEKPLPGAAPSSSSPVRGVHVVVSLQATVPDDMLTCGVCNVSKPPSGFSGFQYRHAMFWLKNKGGNAVEGSWAKDSGGNNKSKSGGAWGGWDVGEIGYAEGGSGRCHWDDRFAAPEAPPEVPPDAPNAALGAIGDALGGVLEREGEGDTVDRRADDDGEGSGGGGSGGGGGGVSNNNTNDNANDNANGSDHTGSSNIKINKHSARCNQCLDQDPKVIEERRCIALNKEDATRVTCATCGEGFTSRTKLFKHIGESGHGDV